MNTNSTAAIGGKTDCDMLVNLKCVDIRPGMFSDERVVEIWHFDCGLESFIVPLNRIKGDHLIVTLKAVSGDNAIVVIPTPQGKTVHVLKSQIVEEL